MRLFTKVDKVNRVQPPLSVNKDIHMCRQHKAMIEPELKTCTNLDEIDVQK